MPVPTQISSRNARLTLFISFLTDLAFILPIWLIFSTHELGLSAALASALFMVIWLGSALLEVPTGALADRLGRKRMFLIGAALLSLYPVAYMLELPIWAIFLISIVAAFGSALRSGTLVPLTHASYQKEGRSDRDYHAFLSSEKTVTFIARALSGIGGGILYAIDPHSPYLAMFIVYFVACIAGLFLKDESTHSKLANRVHIGDALKAMKRTPLIVIIFSIYITHNLVGEAIWTGYQLFFENDGVSPQAIGIVFSAIALVSALGAYATRFIMRRMGVLLIEVIASILVLATAAMLALPWVAAHFLAIIPMSFAMGLSFTPITATVQKYIAPAFHSTALSVASLLQYGIYGLASIYVGLFIDWFGSTTSRYILFIEALIAVVIISSFYLINRRRDVILSPKEDPAEVG